MSWDQIYYYLDKVFDKEFNNMFSLLQNAKLIATNFRNIL